MVLICMYRWSCVDAMLWMVLCVREHGHVRLFIAAAATVTEDNNYALFLT